MARCKDDNKRKKTTDLAREPKSSAQQAKRTLFAPTKHWGGQREDWQQLRSQFRILNNTEQSGSNSVHGGERTDQKAPGS